MKPQDFIEMVCRRQESCLALLEEKALEYGNAIVPEVGAEFIRAYLKTLFHPPSKHPLKKRHTLPPER